MALNQVENQYDFVQALAWVPRRFAYSVVYTLMHRPPLCQVRPVYRVKTYLA